MEMGGGSLMSIGQGVGEKKALKAIEQALHHPLLESVVLENAAGMIANFTGGSDLTFLEVTEALTFLQEQAGNHAEIIPGVTNDDRMEDRAQVILVITGLGGTPIDEALPAMECSQSAPQPVMVEKHQPAVAVSSIPLPNQSKSVLPQVEMTTTGTNLDIPAFMRRRYRVAG
jgi:cell division protein FtsZ